MKAIKKDIEAPLRTPDIVLIGSGIMSATLGVLLKELEPDLTIDIFERLDGIAGESTSVWNNAGTGHSAFCELNYTPELPDGRIDIQKAVNIASSFEESLQFWTYLIENGCIENPDRFIQKVPHLSFVWGDKNVKFLRKRFEALKKSSLFSEMEYTEEKNTISQWIPLVMEGRDPTFRCAATKVEMGTDINFGVLTDQLFNNLKERDGVNLFLNHEVKKLNQKSDESWHLAIKDKRTGAKVSVTTKFVFIGAGGASLPLLLKSGIPEGKKYGGFPVSGQWLKCINGKISEKHQAKVYGKAASGSPPMSVPHLDTRLIDGKRELLFGPFAGFTTKFLKNGSYLDLPSSITPSNARTLASAGYKNFSLTKYLLNQARLTPEERIEALRQYFPMAKMQDWEIKEAGKRVQVIKKDPKLGSIVEFGTEIVASEDGSIAALLGASPGASTSVSIMLMLINKCVKDKVKSSRWKEKIKLMIPTYEVNLEENTDLLEKLKARTKELLKLENLKCKEAIKA